MRLLVAFEEHNRVIDLQEKCAESELRQAIREKFPDVDINSTFIEVFDKDFEAYVDYDCGAVLEDKGKILLVQKRNPPGIEVEPSSVVVSNNGTEGVQFVRSELEFVLPDFPLDIVLSLKAQKDKACLTNTLRKRIIQWIYHLLCEYSLYPGRLYAEAARQLILKHPDLRDSIGTGYDSWHRSLRFKAKYERRKLQGLGILPNNGATSSKGTTAVADVSDPRRCYRTPVCAQFGALDVSEDRHSVAGHVNTMKRELKKQVPDKEIVNDAMGRTFQARRELVSSAASISDILEDYPALKLKQQIFYEFERITSINLKQRFFEMASENLTAVLELTENKPKPDIFYKTLERLDVVEESEKQELNCLIFFCLFPLLLKETHNSFITCETCPAVYPIAVCPTTSTERCSVLFENQAYEAEGPLEAVALCFCLAWVFDLQYFVKCRRTFVCFERLAGLKHSKLGCMGTRLLTALSSKRT
ncbi:uncharacterized protein LOC115317129 [Ixodes scapularis]|uniref:uncharacterized protein LOC115317129 n=1 Tax=Ixodes scapularis TaxID=6945 RepID=UPI001A9E8DF3|nr:uncharacterized protein LOC115317129 [Ixodes scapularis]